jgi:hypothetical protein
MPQALRLGANPPFQRVEETTGACKKARLFAIVMVFCCAAASAASPFEKNEGAAAIFLQTQRKNQPASVLGIG